MGAGQARLTEDRMLAFAVTSSRPCRVLASAEMRAALLPSGMPVSDSPPRRPRTLFSLGLVVRLMPTQLTSTFLMPTQFMSLAELSSLSGSGRRSSGGGLSDGAAPYKPGTLHPP